MAIRRTISVFGFPISFPSAMEKARLAHRLGVSALRPSRATPLLDVQFIKDVQSLRRQGYRARSTEKLLGDGFALDYRARVLYYPCRAPLSLRIAPGQGKHPLLARAILLALSLLGESGGVQSTARVLSLHASAVMTPRGALLFCGRSTFGKSTISGRLLQRFRKLEDDQAFLLLGKNARLADFAAGKPARIAGLFWLKKSKRFCIEPMPSAEAASLLLSPMVHSTVPSVVAARLKLLSTLLQQVPCCRLEFRKESAPLLKLLRAHHYA